MGQNFLNTLNLLNREQKLFETRTIFLSSAVDAHSANRVVMDLLALDEMGSEPITLVLNSPGGEVNSGFSIYDTIRYIDSSVTILTAGLCASIATIINSAVDKKYRCSLPNSKFLIHQPLIGGVVQGPATDLEITATQILKTREKVNKVLADACEQPMEKVQKDTSRDYWMDSDEALDYGLIGRIVQNKSELFS